MTDQQYTFIHERIILPEVYKAAFAETMCLHLPIDILDELAVRETIKRRLKLFKTISNVKGAMKPHILAVISRQMKGEIDSNHGHLFIDGEIKFGIVQMIFATYLKLLWCLIPGAKEPKVCPIGNKVWHKVFDYLPSNLREKYCTKDWSDYNDANDYKEIFNFIETIAKSENKSIAEWELDFTI